eukprot:CAMPEP_0196590760 /NCGR_PEP_ID=MMETSP1081-20130531/67444_1 /TAXON_ID=36882 /ORGANISM="Pyramimonas amylifera, Strain CCMP720" /LENGTH=160 /DNA_ID=CAMNT_0041913949 /DNA_START=274 /DNA_END=756 /DNA_ORIENTATION=-
MQALSLAAIFKRSVNVSVGRRRPSWFARVAANYHVADASMSYPSGHSAYSWASMGILSLFLMGKWRVLHRDRFQMLHLVLALLPIGVSTFIAVSRLVDYHHDFSDVNAGSFLGLCCAVLCYHLQYPPAWSSACDVPNSRRQDTNDVDAALFSADSDNSTL